MKNLFYKKFKMKLKESRCFMPMFMKIDLQMNLVSGKAMFQLISIFVTPSILVHRKNWLEFFMLYFFEESGLDRSENCEDRYADQCYEWSGIHIKSSEKNSRFNFR